jgi:DNA mismatch endonuclease (patch repair protein)
MARPAAAAQTLVPFKRGPGLTTAERSRLMGRVRQSKTAPEEAVAAWLRAHRLGYRRNVRALPGRPDFANRRAGFVIFVHGCYWHRHPGCARSTTPTRNRGFWVDKFAANVARDAARSAELEEAGFRTLVVWECETEDPSALDEKLGSLLESTTVRAEPGSANPSGERTTVGTARGARAFARAGIEGAGS